MTKIEILKKEIDSLNEQISILEKAESVYDYSNYENRYFKYFGVVFFIKEWLKDGSDQNGTRFNIICVTEDCIKYIEKPIYFMILSEITKEEYEIQFNKTLKLLK